MLRRLAVLGGALYLLSLPVATAAAASGPWWNIVTGSRPTNLWEPQNQIQKIVAPETPYLLFVNKEVVGFFNEPFPPGTAENIETALEGAYGTGDVEVTGGPSGQAPLIVTSIGDDAGRPVPPIEIFVPGQDAEPRSVTIVQTGGSGRLVVSLTNVGDGALNAEGSSLKIVDELPEGVEATGVEAFAGVQGRSGPVKCEIEAPDQVSCVFNSVLTSFEAIELEIPVVLTGEPPTKGNPGKVKVIGGNAPVASAVQDITVTPEDTPFGVEYFSMQSEDEGGSAALLAGRHPFQLTTSIQFNAGRMKPAATRERSAVEQPAQPRNQRFVLPPGLIGNLATTPQCSMTDFFEENRKSESTNTCPDAAAIGAVSLSVFVADPVNFVHLAVPVFNLPPAAGEPARFGFRFASAAVIVDTAVDPTNDYQIVASVNNLSQAPVALAATLTLWGTPGDPRHDSARGWGCVYNLENIEPCERPAGLSETAFLRQPVSCGTALDFEVEVEPWNVSLGSLIDRDTYSGEPLSGCNQIPFDPKVSASPTSKLAGNPSGLGFQLDMPNSGLLSGPAIAEGQPKRIEVTLPEGMTLNPSQGEGLVGCSAADLARETVESRPGEGCPEASKVGDVKISTPLLKEEARGSVYVASPYENPFNSLIALYVVAKIPERGVLVKQAGVVKTDPKTGQITTVFDDLPQVPLASVRFDLRPGGRSSLVTPPACGQYDLVARFTPWSASKPDAPTPAEVVTRTSSFEIERGVTGGECPGGGIPPFRPDLLAGTINNAAKRFSPFSIRLTRKDGEQEFTNFSIKLPPGVIGKLAGVGVCPDAAIALAKSRTGQNGAQEEIDNPSCPANSQVGRSLAGSGVGASLTYVPGKIYLAGPFNGAPLSMVAITAAKVGPFDLGTVVIRLALRIDPETAEVFVDPTGSDPLPHIIQGIEVHLRDIRAYVDRPEFVLNPTNCRRTSTASTVLGSGLNFASAIDDEPVDVTSPFQAADCASLGFKPKLSLRLKGGTKRGDNPRLRAVLKSRPGDANIGKIQVTLPHSEFIEQSHFKTICTRVQFAAGAIPGEGCPKNSIYGYVRVFTPLLDSPVEGPVFLRSSNHPLPDLVFALHNNQINLNVDGRVDSVKGGRLRSTFELLPDAPVTKAVLTMQGGKKGLFVNSTDLCRRKHNAIVAFDGQNGKIHDFNTPLRPQCGKKSKGSKSRAR